MSAFLLRFSVLRTCMLTWHLHRFGFSFLGRPFSEASLIGYAYAFEQRTMNRKKVQPYLIPNTEIADVI